MTVGEKMEQARIEAGLSREELAIKLGTSSQTIWRREKNKVTITTEEIEKASAALGKPLSYFYGKEGADYIGQCAWVPLLSAERVACCGRGNHVLDSPVEVGEWCLLYKRLTRMSIGELTGESVRKDLMAR